MPAFFDVVIPTARMGSRVDGLLADLTRELTPNGESVSRLVVVDDQAVTDVRPLLLAGEQPLVHEWPSPENGPAINRNRGAAGSTASWLVFLDDDVRLVPGWGSALVALLRDPTAPDLIGGRIGSQQPRNWFSQAAEDFVVRHRHYPEGWYLAAAHLLVRREAFDALDGFDTRFSYGAEDWDLCARAHAAKLRIGVTDQVAVAHANPVTWGQLRLKAEQYGRANASFDAPAQGEAAPPLDVQPTESSVTPTRAQLPGPVRGIQWAASEYTALRSAGRSRVRAARTMALYVPWMATYLRSQSVGSEGRS